MVEFVNPSNRIVVLTGPNKETVQFGKFERKKLPLWFKRYVPRYLREVTQLNQSQKVEIEINKNRGKHVLNRRRQQNMAVAAQQRLQKIQERESRKGRLSAARKLATAVRGQVNRVQPRKVIGRATMMTTKATEYYKNLMKRCTFPISNDIGIGILSYNRLDCITRLVNSIRKFTNLSKTTVVISDESTDNSVKNYLKSINDISVIFNKRIGIAGNTNRLLRCLSRFRYKVVLNDDVEVLRDGWEYFYTNAIYATKIRHFCMRQYGIYGAREKDGILHTVNGIKVHTIQEKPHGAVLAFDQKAFEAVGYFDESFGLYGMEHVDWSHRVSMSDVQQPGYHDVDGSHLFYKVHSSKSAMENRSSHLSDARKKFEKFKGDKKRIYVEPSKNSIIDGVSYIVPFRGSERSDAIKVVFLNVKGQCFPNIEIIMVEQDDKPKFSQSDFFGGRYLFVKGGKKEPFIKAAAFNAGIMQASYEKIILHDADMLARSGYTKSMFRRLLTSDGVHVGKNVLYLSRKSCNKLYTKARLLDDFITERVVGYFEGGSLGCTKSAFIKIGGFMERFVGYGMEDTEFFSRLSSLSGFHNERVEDFVHVWHIRTPGWNELHNKNKKIGSEWRKNPMVKRIALLNQEFVAKYLLDQK